jgi:hypothetical protein
MGSGIKIAGFWQIERELGIFGGIRVKGLCIFG